MLEVVNKLISSDIPNEITHVNLKFNSDDVARLKSLSRLVEDNNIRSVVVSMGGLSGEVGDFVVMDENNESDYSIDAAEIRVCRGNYGIPVIYGKYCGTAYECEEFHF
ncbi:MAG: hypothetical protein QM504_10330 [Pseudomonadota bacterium]